MCVSLSPLEGIRYVCHHLHDADPAPTLFSLFLGVVVGSLLHPPSLARVTSQGLYRLGFPSIINVCEAKNLDPPSLGGRSYSPRVRGFGSRSGRPQTIHYSELPLADI